MQPKEMQKEPEQIFSDLDGVRTRDLYDFGANH